MSHWRRAALLAGTLAVVAAPADAATRDWAGAGAAAGTLAYERPLPTYLAACRWDIPFALALDAPAFAMHTPVGDRVVPLSVRGSGNGRGSCVSETSASGDLRLAIDAGELHCDVPAVFVRVGAALSLVAGSPTCRWGDDGIAPGYNWTFSLAYQEGRLAGTVTWTR